MKTQRTSDAVKILHQRYIKNSRKRKESLQRERENIGIAEQLYNLRTKAKLSQKEMNSRLAKLSEFQSPVKSGYLRRYADKVSSASTGAVFE